MACLVGWSRPLFLRRSEPLITSPIPGWAALAIHVTIGQQRREVAKGITWVPHLFPPCCTAVPPPVAGEAHYPCLRPLSKPQPRMSPSVWARAVFLAVGQIVSRTESSGRHCVHFVDARCSDLSFLQREYPSTPLPTHWTQKALLKGQLPESSEFIFLPLECMCLTKASRGQAPLAHAPRSA